MLGEIGRCIDDLAYLRVDRLQLLLIHLGREKPVTDLLDRILIMPDFLDLLAGAVFRGVGHRMAAVSVGLHLKNKGPLAFTAPGNRLVAGGLDGADIHAVDLLAGNVEGVAALGEIGLRRGTRHRGAHGVAVVLDYIDHRQLPELGHVETLIDLALVRSAIAEIGHADRVVTSVTIGEGKPGAERDLRADDAVTAVEVLLLAEHVHGAALALGVATLPAGQLGHHALGIHAAGEHMPVVPVACYDLVTLLQGHLHPDDDGLLADIEMAEAADRAHAIELAGLFLKAPDQQHVAERGKFLFPGELWGRAAPFVLLGFLRDAFLGYGHGKSG